MQAIHQPMIKNLEPAILGNAGSWFATLVTWQTAQQVLAVVATFCSVLVSLATLLWIRKQSRALDEKNKDSN
jgi:hypothetical protein